MATDDSTLDVPLKQCSRKEMCANPDGDWQPATTDHFRLKQGRLNSRCRHCERSDHLKYRSELPGGWQAYQKRWKDANPDKQRAYGIRYEQSHPEKIKEKTRRAKERYHADPIERARKKASGRASYWRHVERRREDARNLYHKSSDARKAGVKKYQAENPHIRKAAETRRRTRKKGLPSAFTGEDWLRSLNYFNGCCAVCGHPLRDLFGMHTAAADHWIPLSSPNCPGTVPTNIVPLCHGEGGCNNTKHASEPVEWLARTFGKRRAKTILNRIEAYFAWIRTQDGND
jgi:hypothetical protein